MAELHALLLAAGGSSRLGRPKQLLSYHGETLVRRGARLLLGITSRVTVVTGAEADAVTESLAGLAVRTTRNAQWRQGIGGSIALAAREIEAETDGCLVMLCDQYLVGCDDLSRLVRAWRDRPERIAAARWAEGFGPPVVFPGRFMPELARLEGDRGARRLLTAHRASVTFVDLPNAAADVDDAGDLERFRARERAGSVTPAIGTQRPSR